MRLLWWQQLPLLILIQLLYPNKANNKLYAQALFTFKSSFSDPQQFRCSITKYPCQGQLACHNCYELKDPGAFSLGLAAKIDGNNDVPTLTTLQEAQDSRPGGKRVGAIVGGVVVAALVVIVIVLIVYIYLMRVRRLIRQTSETASSVPCPAVELGRDKTFDNVGLPPYDTHYIRQFTLLELEQATQNFSQINVIGEGRFGLVYKGLLQDGSIVAIKRRLFPLIQDLNTSVKQIARIHHNHLVKLIGYYEDSYQQLLVCEHLPNGNAGNHLYDSEGLPIGKLDMRRRLSIALGASKGMEHLHNLVSPMMHAHFRTRNVLVDGDFTAKVSNYGFCKMQANADQAGPSSNIDCFLDPELNLSQNFSEKSDVYSFGVFLLELISGHEAYNRNLSNSEDNLVIQAKYSNDLDKFVDVTLRGHERHAARRVMELALLCVDVSYRRPSMGQIVQVLQRILADLGPLHSQISEEIGVVTLGSELFK